jgi:hypothetical protein
MAKKDLMLKGEVPFARQLLMFKENIGAHAVALGLTPAQVAGQAADADYYSYVVFSHNLVQTHAKAWTVLKKSLRRRDPSVVAENMSAFTLLTSVPAVAPGLEQRFRNLVRLVKASVNYLPAIGLQLGIEAVDHAAPDYAIIQPKLTAQINGDHVELGWDWQGQRAYLDLCELQVNRGDGRGFGPFRHSVTPGSVDKTPFPATPARWQYRAMYHLGDTPVGVWSQTATVNVPP